MKYNSTVDVLLSLSHHLNSTLPAIPETITLSWPILPANILSPHYLERATRWVRAFLLGIWANKVKDVF